jgi:hypothetical protein
LPALDTVEQRVIYPDQAQEWLSNAMYDKQRPLRQQKVMFYASLMKQGEWMPNTLLRFGVLDGKLHNIDGQHRLAALIESQTPQKFFVSLEHVRDDYELGLLYASIDSGNSRTPYDKLHALGVDAFYGWTATELNIAATAVKFISMDFRQNHTSSDFSTKSTTSLLDKYASSFDTYRQFTEKLPIYMISPAKRRSTVAVALITIQQSSRKYGADKPKEFWGGAFSLENISKNDPRKVAFDHLVGTGMEGGGQSAKKMIMSAAKSARILANCWNAFAEDRPLSFTRAVETMPIRIAGSLYDGKRTEVETIRCM